MLFMVSMATSGIDFYQMQCLCMISLDQQELYQDWPVALS